MGDVMSTGEKRDINMVSLLWAGPEMAAEIAQLHARLFDPGWDQPSVAKLLEHPGSTTLIGRTGFPKTSVGFAMAQIAADDAEILAIGVDEGWQRLGLGKKLVEGVVRSLARAGVKRLFLEVADDNAAARALYAKAGFLEAARRKGYYARSAGPAVDALVLSKAL